MCASVVYIIRVDTGLSRGISVLTNRFILFKCLKLEIGESDCSHLFCEFHFFKVTFIYLDSLLLTGFTQFSDGSVLKVFFNVGWALRAAWVGGGCLEKQKVTSRKVIIIGLYVGRLRNCETTSLLFCEEGFGLFNGPKNAED